MQFFGILYVNTFSKTFEQTFLIELLNSNKKETIRAFWDLITPDRILSSQNNQRMIPYSFYITVSTYGANLKKG